MGRSKESVEEDYIGSLIKELRYTRERDVSLTRLWKATELALTLMPDRNKRLQCYHMNNRYDKET